ncbi:MAG: PhnD/SsuA/transferrin family substrate-binding protein [Planctomycetota bacterium]
MQTLRARTYLSPSLPFALFERVVDEVAYRLGLRAELSQETGISGPMAGDHDPFRAGELDLAFLCSPSYLYLAALDPPSVALAEAGFVFDDVRNGGRPEYFSHVVVRSDDPAQSFDDLAGARWGSNDPCSLSGHFAALQALQQRSSGTHFFRAQVFTGSHERSVAALLAGEIDAAAIDSNVLSRYHSEAPDLPLRVIDSFGPFPIQPIVLSTAFAARYGAAVSAALLAIEHRALTCLGVARFVPVDASLYAEERQCLIELGQLACSR